MKIICLLFVLSLFCITDAKASGCDWSESGLNEVGSIAFKTSGTLSCIKNDPCTFAMSSGGTDAVIVLTGPKNVLPGQTWLKHLDAKFKKMQEYGSCFDDAEVMVIEVVINGVVFSSRQLSYDYPVFTN